MALILMPKVETLGQLDNTLILKDIRHMPMHMEDMPREPIYNHHPSTPLGILKVVIT